MTSTIDIEKIEFDGGKIKSLRGSQSQASIARLIGITRQSLNQIESGQTKPSADTLLKLCAVLQIPISELIKESF